jgi:Domain of unknown function (DUF4265)
MSTSTKINFKLRSDADGYPPVAVESLWANRVGSLFEIDSIPFFVSDATVGDLVRALPDSTGALWFESVEHRSPRSLIRVVFIKPDCEPLVVAKLSALGCGTEGMKAYKLLAVDIPADVELADVQSYLRAEALVGHLDYEEALLRHGG